MAACRAERLATLTTVLISSAFAAAQEFVSLAGAEVYRGNAEKEKRIYPGGPFDPLGFAKVLQPQSSMPSIMKLSISGVQDSFSSGQTSGIVSRRALSASVK